MPKDKRFSDQDDIRRHASNYYLGQTSCQSDNDQKAKIEQALARNSFTSWRAEFDTREQAMNAARALADYGLFVLGGVLQEVDDNE